MWTNQHAHLALLSFNRATRVDHRQSKLRNHAIILFEDAALKDFETLFRIIGPTEVHAGLVMLETWSTRNDTIDRDVQRRSEEESDGGFDGERINVTHPTTIATANDVASIRRVDVTIGEHDRAGFQRRSEVARGAVRTTSRVQPRKSRGRAQGTSLGAARRYQAARR